MGQSNKTVAAIIQLRKGINYYQLGLKMQKKVKTLSVRWTFKAKTSMLKIILGTLH